MPRLTVLSLLATALAVQAQSTPVIGGNCKLGMQDVQIGGKQTQFFLKCEAASDSPEGDGVWVVKSRAASPPASESVQHRPSKKPANPNICEQDNGARESESCAVSAMCLQADVNNPVNYLQCDQTSMRWVKKACQETYIFSFEQQTCTIPRKLSGPSPKSLANLSLLSNNCSQCPLGTVCENGRCTPAHGSTLCADGSAPVGTCPCQDDSECTAQGVCCLRSPSCIRCSNAKPCPQPLLCSPDNCCESRKHRSPSKPLLLPFVSPADLFDLGVVQGPAPGFRVVSLPHAKKFATEVEEEATYAPLPIEVVDNTVQETTPASPSSTTTSYEPPGAGSSLGGRCMGQADCSSDEDCPSSFVCDTACCRLSLCPGHVPVRFSCSSNYQCGSKEKCFLGGCCPLSNKESLAVEDQAVEESENPYDGEEIPSSMKMTTTSRPKTPTTQRPLHPTSMMPSFGPSDVCEVDPRVTNCSLASPCPESSECMFGVCCRLTVAKCASGLLALALPESCRASDDCPLASRCEYSRCCPLENAEVTRNDEPGPIVVTKSVSDISLLKKPRCLQSPRCSSISLCPPKFTCSLEGKCCRLDVFCPDGTVPEDSCDDNHLCPSSAHSCMKFGQQRVCCVSRQQAVSGLVCTFSSCSNSNPCSSGTCNNGYCCSSGSSNSQPTIIATNSTSNATSTLTRMKRNETSLLKEDDWPIGPPGYGFPENLADLDSILVPATGDGHTCAGGFDSPLKCSVGYECPPGLSCDRLLGYCCPLLLPLTDANNPSRPPSRRPTREEPEKLVFSSRPCCNIASSGGSSGCNGCNQQQQPIIISTCPGGGYPVGSCSSGYCASGYSCVSGSCCPSYNSAPQISVFTCPSGGSAVGACVSGSCATGYSCVSGSCCPSTTTTNPFVCSDGTQAVGGCVNGQCGTGYTCTNGLCCVGTGTSSVRCLDGSAAVGACIPSCTGNACGQVQVTFYCGAGYTCTTGNICCAINSCPNGGTVLGPTVNGLCPSGYTAQNGICCSALCPDGSAGSPAVNNQCPTTLTLTNGVCCASTNTTPVGQCGGTTNPYSIGPCISGVAGPCGQGNGNQPGYACDATLTQCCPVVDTTNLSAQIGPAVTGMCPVGYTAVFGLATDTTGEGICIDLATTQGLCAAANQIGPCANQVCPAGYTCNIYAEICCATGTATFSRLRPGQRLPQHAPTYGRSLNSFTAPRDMNCPDGSVPASGCMNGLCGVGLECHNGVCCPPQSTTPKLKSQCPNSEFAVSGCFGDGSCGASFECVKHLSLCCPPGGNETPASVKNTIRPIGARCFSDDECVGSDEGLSLCHAGVCQCSPIAYSQGIACVRRMALKMNDSPLEKAVEKNEVEKTN